MTYHDIMKTHEVVRFGFPKKGELFLAIHRRGGTCEVIQATKNWKTVMCTIIKKVS